MSGGSRSAGPSGESASFDVFLEGWLARQEHYLDELLCTSENCNGAGEEDLQDLVYRVLNHYQQYYEKKSQLIHQNVTLAFSPPWFSSLERSFLWVAGFKPSLAFRVVRDSVRDLTPNQATGMRSLIEVTRMEEKTLNDDMAKIQESVGAPSWMELARRQDRLVDTEKTEGNVAVRQLNSSLVTVVSNADMLRTRTVARVVEILNPVQSVRYLIAVAQLQLKVRSLGFSMQRQSES
ncbi:hypothetical protein K2173_000046 [Erythroxylum novogranatense]|uniref:DOG1 domain-containing protein n=1 Tax=Erythroxylum novogranatense TaxID=1862640 RepID=A0AAV8SNE9_9ROSI|nr:hypothetical protein K2173_000046 [Erythroxylum novogranatense]